MPTYTIGQLARAAAVPTSTVRFYERRGFLKPDARTDGNYRQYTDASLQRLRFIRTAQATGFSLKDIRELLALAYSDDDPPCKDVLTLAQNRLADVRRKIAELQAVERMLSRSIESCCKSEDDVCVAVNRLRGKSDPLCRPATVKTGPARAKQR